jgi:trehalose 2-sulfotransferase
MRPIISYITWFSQRSGSTLLCKALESTGIAGRPNEWLHDPETFDLFRTYKVNTPEALQKKLWEIGTMPNGVFGLKLSMYDPHHTRMLDVACRIIWHTIIVR